MCHICRPARLLLSYRVRRAEGDKSRRTFLRLHLYCTWRDRRKPKKMSVPFFTHSPPYLARQRNATNVDGPCETQPIVRDGRKSDKGGRIIPFETQPPWSPLPASPILAGTTDADLPRTTPSPARDDNCHDTCSTRPESRSQGDGNMNQMYTSFS